MECKPTRRRELFAPFYFNRDGTCSGTYNRRQGSVRIFFAYRGIKRTFVRDSLATGKRHKTESPRPLFAPDRKPYPFGYGFLRFVESPQTSSDLVRCCCVKILTMRTVNICACFWRRSSNGRQYAPRCSRAPDTARRRRASKPLGSCVRRGFRRSFAYSRRSYLR